MTKMEQLLQELEIYYQKEEILYYYLLQKKEGTRNILIEQELKNIRKKIRKIKGAIKSLATLKKMELQNQLSQTLWNQPLLQNYLGIYQNQKGPYSISTINAINENIVMLTACTTNYFHLHHQTSFYDNAQLDIIILKELEEGLFRYYAREYKKPAKEEYSTTYKTIYSIQDLERDSSYFEEHYIPREFKKICRIAGKKENLSIPYFDIIYEQGKDLKTPNIFREYKKKRTLDIN